MNCEICKKLLLPGDAVDLHLARREAKAHRRCVERDEDYGFCGYCHDAFPASKLNQHGECPKHRGELEVDEETAEGINDIIENRTKDGF